MWVGGGPGVVRVVKACSMKEVRLRGTRWVGACGEVPSNESDRSHEDMMAPPPQTPTSRQALAVTNKLMMRVLVRACGEVPQRRVQAGFATVLLTRDLSTDTRQRPLPGINKRMVRWCVFVERCRRSGKKRHRPTSTHQTPLPIIGKNR